MDRLWPCPAARFRRIVPSVAARTRCERPTAINAANGSRRCPLPKEPEGRVKLYADIAHPINSDCRDMIQRKVVDAFEAELERAQQPDYVSRYEEDYDEPDDDDFRSSTPPRRVRPDPPHGREDASRHDSKASANNPLQRDSEDFGAGIF